MSTSRSLWYLSLLYGVLHAEFLVAADVSPTDDTPVRELSVREFLSEISPSSSPAAVVPASQSGSSAISLGDFIQSIESQDGAVDTQNAVSNSVGTTDTGPWLDAVVPAETGPWLDSAVPTDTGPWLNDNAIADTEIVDAAVEETEEVEEETEEVVAGAPVFYIEEPEPILTLEVPASVEQDSAVTDTGLADVIVETPPEMAMEETAVEEAEVDEPAIAEIAIEEPVIEEPAVEEPIAEELAVEESVVEEPAGEELAEEELAAAPAEEEQSVQVPPVVSSSLADRVAAMIGTPVQEIGSGDLLDLNTAVRTAMTSHPSVVESMGELYSSMEEVDVARAGYFPRVSAGIGNGYRRASSTSWDNYNVSASQTLYDFGKTSSSVDVAESGVERSRADILLTMDDLALDTAKAFIEVQRGQALLEVARAQTVAVAEIMGLAEARAQRGASTRSDVLQARSRHEAALAMEMQLQAQLNMWISTLQSYIGQDITQNIDSSFPAGLNQACTAYPEDFSTVPRMLAADAALEEAQARARQARSNLFPTISLKANYGNVNNPSNVAFDQDFAERDFSVSVSLDASLFEGGAARSRRQAAEYSLQAARAGKERALLEVNRSFREAHDQTRSFIDRMEYLDSRFESIVSTQELYREQYLSLGTRTLLDLLNTEQEIYQSQFEREHTLHDLRQLQMVCLHSLGQLRNVFDIDTRIAEGTEQ